MRHESRRRRGSSCSPSIESVRTRRRDRAETGDALAAPGRPACRGRGTTAAVEKARALLDGDEASADGRVNAGLARRARLFTATRLEGRLASSASATASARMRCFHSSRVRVSRTGPTTSPTRPSTSKPPRQPIRTQTKGKRVPLCATTGRTILSPQSRTRQPSANERSAGVVRPPRPVSEANAMTASVTEERHERERSGDRRPQGGVRRAGDRVRDPSCDTRRTARRPACCSRRRAPPAWRRRRKPSARSPMR